MKAFRAVLGVVALASAGAAFAAQDYESYRRYEERKRETSVFLRGGIGAYTGELGSALNVGPAWGLTVDMQPWNILGLELGYQGSRNAVTGSAPGIALRNGGDALIKIAPPFLVAVKPFVGAGVGASYVSTSGALLRNDLMEEIPLAAGIEFNNRAVTAGIRATYRVLIDDQFAGAGTSGNLFDTELTLGGRF